MQKEGKMAGAVVQLVTFVLILITLFTHYCHAAVDPTCTLASGKLKQKGCSANMKIDWWNFAPYVYSIQGKLPTDLTINGTFKDIVERTIRSCCGECVQFTYLNAAQNSEILKNRIGTNGSVVSFPVYGTTATLKFQSYPYFPVIESPGVIYVKPVPKSGTSANDVLSAVFSGWPILVLTLIMAALSGIIMWACDTYSNPEEFPRPFFQGAWQGFWWAFVSMTTVGYGDKAPKSFIGRVFAFFWVLIGLVIISIFTATITTALTAVSLDNDVKLFGKTIVALNHTEEQRYGVRKNAKIVKVANVKEFIDTITTSTGNTKPNGGLIDSYVAGFEKDRINEDKGLVVAKIFDHSFSYGFVVANQLDNTVLPKCLRRQLSSDESVIVDQIQRTMKALPEPKQSAAQAKSANMFDASSDVYKMCIFVCLGIIGFLALCGLAWEYLYWKPRLVKEEKDQTPGYKEREVTPHTSYEELVSIQCQELDNVMIAEVMSFYKVFNKKMGEIKALHLEHYKEHQEVNPVFLQDNYNNPDKSEMEENNDVIEMGEVENAKENELYPNIEKEPTTDV